MDLNTLWFILISVLFTGFFFLEGFDFGVAILLPFIAKKDDERRIIINTIGPFWDGNEVWLITAGGAIFAAFPIWYATMFSGFYLALLIILVALILRAVAFEFRSKKEALIWRSGWDNTISLSSLLLAVLWGTAMANLIKGVPIDKSMNYIGGFLDLVSIYTVFAGIVSLMVFIFHGAVFLTLKTEGAIKERAFRASKSFGLYASFASIIFVALTLAYTDQFSSSIALISAIFAVLLLIVSCYFITQRRSRLAMILNGLSIALGSASLFTGLFPRVIISSIKPEFSLTIYNASSSAATLSLMTKVALVFVPIVLGYQIWTYYIFRKRISTKDLEY